MPSSSAGIGKLLAVRREIIRKVRQVGLTQTAAHILRRMADEVRRIGGGGDHADTLDTEFGIETSGRIRVGALDIPDDRLEHVFAYQPVSSDFLLRALERLPIDHQEYMFIDIGSGKGRALLLASRFGFKEIVGVEISAALCQTAVENVSRYQDPLQKCKRIRVLCQDATNYVLPRENIVLFFYNPFDEQMMRLLAANVRQALCANGRDLYLIYVNPLFRRIWDELGPLELMENSDIGAVYRTKRA